jgi:O-antigen ligase
MFGVLCLAIYGIGIGVSQSLMSLGGTLFAIWGLVFLWKNLKGDGIPSKLALSSLLLVIFHLTGVLLRDRDRVFGRALELIPLYFVPLGILTLHKHFDETYKTYAAKVLNSLTMLSVSVSCCYAIYQFLFLKVPGIAFFNNPIYLAYALLPVFLLYLWKMYQPHSSHNFRLKGFVFLVFLGLIATQNRVTPLVALLAIFSLELKKIRTEKFFSAKKYLLAFSAALAFAALGFALNPTLREKLSRPIGMQDPSASARVTVWKENFSLFLHEPLTGKGYLKNGIDTAERTEYQNHWSPGTLIYAHSVYLQILAEGGILGFLLLGFWLYTLMKIDRGVFFVVLFFFLIAGITENITVNSKPFHAFLFTVGAFRFLVLNHRSKLY